MSQKITILDIAKKLNLTPATVSRALNDHPRISEATKKLVNATAKKLKYQRNKIASSLRSGKSHTIGVIIPSARMNFFGAVVHGIENMASKNEYSIILYQSEESAVLERKAVETFLSARVDGILASVAKEAEDYKHFIDLKKRNVPLVFFDRVYDAMNIPSVVVDDYKGGFMATEHLIKNGYSRIAHVAGPQHLKIFRDRMQGYIDALKVHKRKVLKSLIYEGKLSINSGMQAVEHFLKVNNPPDAIFAVEDWSALGVIKMLKQKKIKVPEEFGVIGFANESFDEHISPSLSSVDQETVQMGREAFNLLLDIIHLKEGKTDKKNKTTIVLEPKLVVRESSFGKQ